jgi:hypothetical protein
MNSVKKMRTEVKKYIDTADEKVVKMIHAMLEVDADAEWWDTMPDNIRSEVEESLKQADNGETMTNEQVKQKYPQWFSK